MGYVLGFQVESDFLSRFTVRQLGDAGHREYWIASDDLAECKERIVGEIEIARRTVEIFNAGAIYIN